MAAENKKKLKMPHIFIILYGIILIVSLLSYVIPAGEYDRVLDEATGRMIPAPTTLSNPVPPPLCSFSGHSRQALWMRDGLWYLPLPYAAVSS